MPILDVTIANRGQDWAQPLVDALAPLWPNEPTWVRVHTVVTAGPGTPVLLRASLLEMPDDRAKLARRITDAAAGALFRAPTDVQVILEDVGGRLAVGGVLVPSAPPRRASSGARWEAIVGYCRAVRIGPHVWVTGTAAVDPEGRPVEGDAFAQATRCLDIIESALAQVGARMEHVVRTRMFVTDIDRDWPLVGKAHAQRFAEVRPATTMVQVQKLIEPWMLVEIEADGHVDGVT